MGQVGAINLLRTTDISTTIMRMDRSFSFLTKAALNYDEAFKLQYSVSFAETSMKDIVHDTVPPRYPSRKSSLFHVGFMRYSRLMKKTAAAAVVEGTP